LKCMGGSGNYDIFVGGHSHLPLNYSWKRVSAHPIRQ
jgi:hypothetical protein